MIPIQSRRGHAILRLLARLLSLGLPIRPDLGPATNCLLGGPQVFLSDLCYLQNQIPRRQTFLFGEIGGQQSDQRCATLSSKLYEVP